MNWDLSKLYGGFESQAFASDIETLEQWIREAGERLTDIQTAKPASASLHDMLLRMQKIVDLSWKLNNYVNLTLAADANCTSALAPRNRLMQIQNTYELLNSAFIHYVGNIPDLNEICASDELICEHRTYLETCREKAKHLIPAQLEAAVLEMQLTGGKAWCRLRDELDAGLMIEVALPDETKQLPLSAVRALAYDADDAVRAAAYQAELGAYPRVETAMAACLNGIKGEALQMCKFRNFQTPLDWALQNSRMDRETLDALLGSLEASLPMFRRYFRLKAKLLGKEGGLRFQDLFAPVGKDSRTYTLDEAEETLLKVFTGCNPAIAKVMSRAFAESWIDSDPKEGKVGGAFCEAVHLEKMSYILTNFDGSYSDVSTLAHELGHAYHDSCLNDTSALLCDLPMPLAETASTFNELILSEEMLSKSDEGVRLALLEQQLSDAAQVVVDILSRFYFEREVFERRASSTLSAKELCEIMRDAQLKTYGDGLDPEYLHPYMWACKPHYYDTDEHFYNFPYAFGQLFATGLYAQWKKQGDAFWKSYRKLLKDSGSGSIYEVVRSVGIDVRDGAFWRDSLQVYEKKLEQLEKLAEK